MYHSYENKKMGAYFGMSLDYLQEQPPLQSVKGLIHFLWNQTESDYHLIIDGIPHTLKPNQITTITFLQKVAFNSDAPLTALFFNREFYCIQDHDKEVSCNGILFFGTSDPPIVQLDEQEARSFGLLREVLIDEFQVNDNIQGEMLQMLLKRFIIKVTRLAKQQVWDTSIGNEKVDTIRKFNVLVDLHFRNKKQVADYADLLFKSPKTLSNIFRQHFNKSPLQLIHERIVLEVKRLLLYTDKSVKEIAFELGYEEDVPLYKLFKKVTGVTPQQFKKDMKPT